MVWTNQHNEVMLQEMYLFEPWKYKRGSKQRGQVIPREKTKQENLSTNWARLYGTDVWRDVKLAQVKISGQNDSPLPVHSDWS